MTAFPAIQKKTRVPFMDLGARLAGARADVDGAIARVLGSSSFILGEEVARFETEFAQFCGTKFAIGVGNGLEALTLALKAIGIGAGNEVIVPANTFIATALAVTAAGADVILVDCEPQTLAIDVDQLRAAITPRTKAVLPVHLYGRTCDIDAILDIASSHDLVVIEDAAQAHGATLGERRAGSFGRAGCFSFYPSKNLGCLGDGGAVVTNDAALAEKLRMLRHYGQGSKHHHEIVAGNSRLDALQAATLRVFLPRLEEDNEKRSAAARRLDGLLADLPIEIPARPREEGWGQDHVHHLYVTQVEDRDLVQAAMSRRGIETAVHYPTPIHLQPAYSHLGKKIGDFPNAERSAKRLLSLPMFPEITEEQLDAVGQALKESIEEVEVQKRRR